MTTVGDMAAFEKRMRDDRGWKRGRFCEELGITQARLRRHLGGSSGDDVGKTLGLAMAAVEASLRPLGEAPDAGLQSLGDQEGAAGARRP